MPSRTRRQTNFGASTPSAPCSGSTLRDGGGDGGDPDGGVGGDGDDHGSVLIMIDRIAGVGDTNCRLDTSGCICHSGGREV